MSHPPAEDRRQQARAAFEQADLCTAMKIVRHCLLADQDDGPMWELCGRIQFSRGQFPETVSALEYASLLVPLTAAGRVCLGRAYGHIGRAELSRDLLVEQIDNPQLSVPQLLQVAAGLDAIDRPTLAMKACHKAIDRDHQIAQAHYDLGYYAGRCGYPDAVVESLARKAVHLAPDVAQYRIGLTGLLVKQGRAAEAYDSIKHLNNDDLVSINCRCCLARMIGLYKQSGDYRRAIVCEQRRLQLEISSPPPDCD